MTKKMHE